MNKIIFKLNKYFKILSDLQKNNICPNITYYRGFWFTEDNDDLASLEIDFIRKAKSIKKIFDNFQETISINKKEMLVHLAGWSTQYKKSGEFLYDIILMHNARLNNAAARAIFPLIIANKIPFKEEIFFKLLKKKSKYSKNKALGIIAFLPIEKIKKLPLAEIEHIKKMTKHKEIMINEPAKIIIKIFFE